MIGGRDTIIRQAQHLQRAQAAQSARMCQLIALEVQLAQRQEAVCVQPFAAAQARIRAVEFDQRLKWSRRLTGAALIVLIALIGGLVGGVGGGGDAVNQEFVGDAAVVLVACRRLCSKERARGRTSRFFGTREIGKRIKAKK